MHTVNIETAKAAKAPDRKALAILAFENACRDPDFSNWRAVAELLRLALPATKAKAVETDSRFAPWADYVISDKTKLKGKSPVIVVQFADGETVRAPAVSLLGKAVNIGRGLRIAFAYYRARIAYKAAKAGCEYSDCVAIPDIVSVTCDVTGAEYDAADCNDRTAAARAGTFSLATAGDPETEYRMEASRLRLAA